MGTGELLIVTFSSSFSQYFTQRFHSHGESTYNTKLSCGAVNGCGVLSISGYQQNLFGLSCYFIKTAKLNRPPTE